MILLVSERNVDQVLLELKEYATEVDVEFVRKSVSAIGNCAIKLDKATPRCIDVLIELIQTRVNYVVQGATHSLTHWLTHSLTHLLTHSQKQLLLLKIFFVNIQIVMIKLLDFYVKI